MNRDASTPAQSSSHPTPTERLLSTATHLAQAEAALKALDARLFGEKPEGKEDFEAIPDTLVGVSTNLHNNAMRVNELVNHILDRL